MSESDGSNPMADVRSFNERLIAEYRANGGKVTGMFANAPLLLLTTTGAKSSLPRTAPLVFGHDGGRLVVIASKAGAPTHPDWYHNLVANPDATVELGAETFPVRASIPQGAERDRIFNAIAAEMPGFADYQRNTDRVIPVVVLDRA